LPYGTTAWEWDTIIPFEPLWAQYKRIIKYNGAIVLTASQPFTSMLVMSNLNMFKYCWYWKKSKPNGWQHSKNRPMTAIEECCVFSKAPMGHLSLLGEKRMRYFPQGIIPIGNKKITAVAHGASMGARPKQVGKEYEAFTNFPTNILEFANVVGSKALHPTQKPVALFEYLIKTYTNEGDLVLDNCMGSGTTLVAAKMLGRKAVGIEISKKYCDIAVDRLRQEVLF
jgi:site-specific DNA-methyltransferase (adenine-specific)